MNPIRIGLLVAASLFVGATASAHGRMVASADKAQLILDIAPAATEVYVDGHKKGTGDDLKQLTLTPGTHVLKLVYAGDEHEDQVELKAGVKTTFSWKFEDDRKSTQGSDFDFMEQATSSALQ